MAKKLIGPLFSRVGGEEGGILGIVCVSAS